MFTTPLHTNTNSIKVKILTIATIIGLAGGFFYVFITGCPYYTTEKTAFCTDRVYNLGDKLLINDNSVDITVMSKEITANKVNWTNCLATTRTAVLKQYNNFLDNAYWTANMTCDDKYYFFIQYSANGMFRNNVRNLNYNYTLLYGSNYFGIWVDNDITYILFINGTQIPISYDKNIAQAFTYDIYYIITGGDLKEEYKCSICFMENGFTASTFTIFITALFSILGQIYKTIQLAINPKIINFDKIDNSEFIPLKSDDT